LKKRTKKLFLRSVMSVGAAKALDRANGSLVASLQAAQPSSEKEVLTSGVFP
jgi:hypothetical protein